MKIFGSDKTSVMWRTSLKARNPEKMKRKSDSKVNFRVGPKVRKKVTQRMQEVTFK